LERIAHLIRQCSQQCSQALLALRDLHAPERAEGKQQQWYQEG